MTNYKTIGLYWIDENGYYHYPKEDQFEFGRMDEQAGGALKDLASRVEGANTLAQNEYNSGYEAGVRNCNADAKAAIILGGFTLGTVLLVTAGALIYCYKKEKLNKKKD